MNDETRRGTLYAAAAYALWGLFPLFWPLLDPASALEVLAHRVLWSLLVVAALLQAGRTWARVRVTRTQFLRLSVASVLLAVNWGTYIYGVDSGQVVETSLGYFVNPLVSVGLGVLVLGERLRAAQKLAPHVEDGQPGGAARLRGQLHPQGVLMASMPLASPLTPRRRDWFRAGPVVMSSSGGSHGPGSLSSRCWPPLPAVQGGTRPGAQPERAGRGHGCDRRTGRSSSRMGRFGRGSTPASCTAGGAYAPRQWPRHVGGAMTEPVPRVVTDGRVGPVDASLVPRFAGPATFARLPRFHEVSNVDVAVVGVPFDAGVSYRPGARFGPAHVRESSRLLRPYNPALQVSPFARLQVADAGDIAVNPFSIDEAVAQVERGADALLERAGRLLTIGGDHTIALPLLRAVARRHGPVAVVHFDAHLDTWDTYFGAAYTHGTPFRRASEEGLIDRSGCLHVGVRPALRLDRPHRRRGPGLRGRAGCRDRGPRLTRGRRAGRRPRAGPAGVCVGRHRRARPGLRTGYRHAGVRWPT